MLAVLAVLGGQVLAAPGGPPGGRRGGEVDRAKMMYDRLVGALKELGLTAEQETQLKTIFESYTQATANWSKEHGEDLRAMQQKMDEARKANDENAMKDLTAARQKLDESRNAIRDDVMKQLAGVLNDKQMARAKEILQPPSRNPIDGLKEIVAKLELKDDLKAKVNEVIDAAKAESDKTRDFRESGKIYYGAVEKIKALLDAEQKAKFEELLKATRDAGMLRMFTGLNLSPEQEKQVTEMMNAVREKADKAEPDARRQIFQDAMKEVEKVLTPEQLKQWQERRARFQRPGGDRGNREGGGERPRTE